MFGTEIVAEAVRLNLTALPSFAAIPVQNLNVVPPGMPLPTCLFHFERAVYSGPISGMSDSETFRVVVRLICEGASSDPILVAAEAQLTSLDGARIDHEGSYLTFGANSEWPLTTVYEGGVFYRQLGTIYDVDLTTG